MASGSAPLDPAGGGELLRLLGPAADDVEDAVLHPPAIARDDWIGPASEACGDLERELRARLGRLLAELEHVLDTARRAL